MRITTLDGLIPGGTLELSESPLLIRSKLGDEVSVTDPLEPERKLPADTSAPFNEILAMSATAETNVLIARFDLDEEEQLDDEVLSLIRNGAQYTVSLGQGDDEDPGSPELHAVMFYVLREGTGGLSLLGLLDIAPPRIFDDDENAVAVLDILGFSNIIRDTSLDELEKKFTNGILGILMVASGLSSGAIVFDDDQNLQFPELASQVAYGVISDTLVLYPKPGTQEPIRVLCETVALLMDWVLMSNWLLRGAIVVGKFRALPDRNVYLGDALLEAHNLELAQQWCGCVLGRNAVARFPDEISGLAERGLILEYNVPFKEAPPEGASRYALNWCYYQRGPDPARIVAIEKLSNTADESGHEKIENTLSFVRELEEREMVSIEPVTASAVNFSPD